MIQFSVVYNYKNKLRKNGTGLIQIRAYSKGKCNYFSTNIYVTPFQWSKKLNQVILKSILQQLEIETVTVYLHLSNKIMNNALDDNVCW